MTERKFAALAFAALCLSVGACKSKDSGATANGMSTAVYSANGSTAMSNGSAPANGTGVIVNEKELTNDQITQLKQMYGAAPPAGQYWYDPRSGLYGYWGREAAGYIRTGHDFGELSPRASNGNTGSFINGREINMTEAQFFYRIFGVVYQGHFWLDGNTGNIGIEGDPTPRANLVRAMQQAGVGANGEYHWRDGSGAVVGGEGSCTFAAIPGAPVYSTPGCG